MKIISWNVNGIRSVYKKGFLKFIEDENPDVICLQEIKSQDTPKYSDLFNPDPTDCYYTNINFATKKGYSGVVIFSKEKPLSINSLLGNERFDTEGRFLEVQFKDYSLINVYIPHGARDKKNLSYKLEVFKKLTEYLFHHPSPRLIICGDFNVALEEIDLANPRQNANNIMFTLEERLAIKKLIECGFVDSFRKFRKGSGHYTWWPYRKGLRERNIGWRIDYVFVSRSLEENLTDAFILKEVFGSDHCPVGIKITI